MSISNEDRQQIIAIIKQNQTLPGAMLPILHGIQDKIGYLPEVAINQIATALNLSRAEVHGVISFYHHFRTSKPGVHIIEVCRGESCQAMGSRALEQQVKQKLGIDYHQTTKDQRYSLEPVYCLGNCACSPAIRIGDDIHGEVDGEKFLTIVDSLSTYALELS
ncbi:MAG: formate dehydrogenase subunit gamma [Gammaproteobacteria bacterium]|nr:formate dehydrogenase subunit gamma [Gammaproteobacteria bacterium]